MGIRTLVVTSLVAIGSFFGFRIPFVGLLTFSWLAYMRAQDLCWGFAKTARFSYLVAAVMLAGWFFHESAKRRFMRWDIRTSIMLLIFVITGIGLTQARQFDEFVRSRYLEFGKILLIAIFTTGQLTSRKRLDLLLWTIALSLGFYGVKNGLRGILTGGAPITQGPGGMIADNNDFALAMVLNIPLLYYLGVTRTEKWLRRGCFAAVFLTMITVFLTHSRGAFLSMCTVLFTFWLRSRYKLAGVLIVGFGVISFFLFVPEHVLDRYSTIGEYEQDASAMGRLRAWGIAMQMIQDHPVFGVGMRNFRQHFLDYVTGVVPFAPEAHNSYLQVWAETGTIAFVLYLTLLGSAFYTLRKLRKLGDRTEGGGWITDRARMLEASMAGFVVGAMFLNRGHFDLTYHLLGIITGLNLVARHWASQPVGQREGDEVEDDWDPLVVSGRSAGPRPALEGAGAWGASGDRGGRKRRVFEDPADRARRAASKRRWGRD